MKWTLWQREAGGEWVLVLTGRPQAVVFKHRKIWNGLSSGALRVVDEAGKIVSESEATS